MPDPGVELSVGIKYRGLDHRQAHRMQLANEFERVLHPVIASLVDDSTCARNHFRKLHGCGYKQES